MNLLKQYLHYQEIHYKKLYWYLCLGNGRHSAYVWAPRSVTPWVWTKVTRGIAGSGVHLMIPLTSFM